MVNPHAPKLLRVFLLQCGSGSRHAKAQTKKSVVEQDVEEFEYNSFSLFRL